MSCCRNWAGGGAPPAPPRAGSSDRRSGRGAGDSPAATAAEEEAEAAAAAARLAPLARLAHCAGASVGGVCACVRYREGVGGEMCEKSFGRKGRCVFLLVTPVVVTYFGNGQPPGGLWANYYFSTLAVDSFGFNTA